MRSQIVLIALLGLLAPTWATELEVIESCWRQLEIRLSDTPIPIAVRHLSNGVKSHGGSATVRVDLIKSRVIMQYQVEKYFQECQDYLRTFMAVLNNNLCSEEISDLLDPHKPSYHLISLGRPNLRMHVDSIAACSYLG